MGLVKEEELELGAGSLGLGFGPFAGDGSKNGQQHLGWQLGSDGSLQSSRTKSEQGSGDVDSDDGGGGGGGGWFVTNNDSNNSNTRLNLAAYWFTAEQWRELQLQGMIYKHLVAGMPIPQEYLRELGWPIHNNPQMIPPAMAAQYYADRTGGAGINVGHPAVHHLPGVVNASATVDLEPQRCRRTDGKKWRCGNEAAPGKRYCEKHLHRSRPRSRKPVEQQQQQQQFMPPQSHAPIIPTSNIKFGIAAAQEPSQVPGRKHPCPPQPPNRPVGLDAPPPPPNKDEISSWNMDRKKARSEEETMVRLGSISKPRPEEETIRQHLNHDNNKLKSERQWQHQMQSQQHQMEQQHSYYPYQAYQDDSFFSLLNSDINSLNERHLSFANPWSSTSTGAGTLSMSHTTEHTDKYIDFARGYDSRSNSLSASVSVSSAHSIPQSSPHLSLVPGAREEGGGLQLLNAGNGGGESTKPPPLWWLADTLLTSDMAAATGTAPPHLQPATDDEEPSGVVSPATADNSSASAAASPTGVLQRPLASISDCSSNSSEAFGLQATGGGAEATGHLMHWMIKH